MENAKKIELRAGDNLESVVYTLLAEKARGNDVYCEFNGVRLSSVDVTMDSAFKAVTGKTKAEYDEYYKQVMKEAQRGERQSGEIIQEWKAKEVINRIREENKAFLAQNAKGNENK